MKRASTLFLQLVVVLVGIGGLAILLWEPQIEGRNAHATLFETYFNDPFLAYAYTASIAFFTALYRVFDLLGYIRRDEVFSEPAVKALRTIRHCAIAIVVFVAGAEAYLSIAVRGKDDIAGGVFVGLLLIFSASVIAAAAAVLERVLQTAVDMKSENDLAA